MVIPFKFALSCSFLVKLIFLKSPCYIFSSLLHCLVLYYLFVYVCVYPTIESFVVFLIAIFPYLDQYMVYGRHSIFFEWKNKKRKKSWLLSLSGIKLCLQECTFVKWIVLVSQLWFCWVKYTVQSDFSQSLHSLWYLVIT